MSATGTKKGILEVFKFACYVGIPISMMSVFANNPDNLEKVIRNVSTMFISLHIKHVGEYHVFLFMPMISIAMKAYQTSELCFCIHL